MALKQSQEVALLKRLQSHDGAIITVRVRYSLANHNFYTMAVYTSNHSAPKNSPSWHLFSHCRWAKWCSQCLSKPICTLFWQNSSISCGSLIIHTHYSPCPQNYCVMLIHVKTKKGQTCSKKQRSRGRGLNVQTRQFNSTIQALPEHEDLFLILQSKFPQQSVFVPEKG